jgi:hypothetical protein
MDASTLPQWGQVLFYIILAVGTALTGVWSYFNKKDKGDASTTPGSSAASSASVISASFIDSKLLKELIEAMRELQDEQGRDAKKAHRLSQDLREAVNELNESMIVQTDTTMNLVRFINREATKTKVPRLERDDG